MWLWLLIAVLKRWAERCAQQLYLLKTIFVIANGKYCRNTKAALFQEE